MSKATEAAIRWAMVVLSSYGVLTIVLGAKTQPKTAAWMLAIVMIAAAIGAWVAR